MQEIEIEILGTGDHIELHHDVMSLMSALREADEVKITRHVMLRKSLDLGSLDLPEMTVLAPVATAIIGAFGGWFAARTGRKVRLKVGDLEAEAHSIEDVQKLFALADARVKPIQQQKE
jgi:hypothetical protein